MRRLASLLLLLATAASAQHLQMGTAEVDITPPAGTPMAGYYTLRIATGTHDPLHVKAMVFADGSTKVAIVACDLVSLPRLLSEQARALIQQQTGLAPGHIMISATHDHTTPVVMTTPSRFNLEGRPRQLAEAYTAALPGKIAEAVRKANASLLPVEMLAGVGDDKTLGFNRRFFMKDGTVGWNPGKLNPNISRPAGPVDTGLPVLYFQTPGQKKPVAAYVNFSVHQDTTGGLLFSGDYSYTLSKLVQRAKGDAFFTLFTIGAAGNVNHIDVSRKEPQQGFEEAARIGATLAADVLKIIPEASVVAHPVIRVSDRILKIPVPTYSDAEIATETHIAASLGTPQPAPFLDLVKAARILELNAQHGQPLDAEVQVFTFGDQVAIVGFPGEMFAEFGLSLKQDSPFPVTILAELANGAYVYIPNRIAFEEGNYEPIAARLPQGTGEKLMDQAFQQLLHLARRPYDEASSANQPKGDTQ